MAGKARKLFCIPEEVFFEWQRGTYKSHTETQSFTSFTPGFCPILERKRILHWTSASEKSWRAASFLCSASVCHTPMKSSQICGAPSLSLLSSYFLVLPLILCTVSHQTSAGAVMRRTKSLQKKQPTTPGWLVNTTRDLTKMLLLKWNRKWWLGSTVLKCFIH